MRACEIDSYESLLSNEVQSTHQLSVHELDSPLRKPNLEYELQTTHARIMAQYDKDVHDYYMHPCCSCCMLFKRKSVSVKTVLELQSGLHSKIFCCVRTVQQPANPS